MPETRTDGDYGWRGGIHLEMSMIETSLSVPAERQKELFGQFDQYVKKIERALQVAVLSRDGEIPETASPTNAVRAKKDF